MRSKQHPASAHEEYPVNDPGRSNENQTGKQMEPAKQSKQENRETGQHSRSVGGAVYAACPDEFAIDSGQWIATQDNRLSAQPVLDRCGHNADLVFCPTMSGGTGEDKLRFN
jgi:hypothetical protein